MNRFGYRAAAAAIQLRDYQTECVDALVKEVTGRAARRTTSPATSRWAAASA